MSQTPIVAAFASAVMLKEWKLAQAKAEGETVVTTSWHTAVETRCHAWHTPMAGFMKINVDVVFFEDSNQTGLGE